MFGHPVAENPTIVMQAAVNTVIRVGDRLVGENTDGKGFMRSLKDYAPVEAMHRVLSEEFKRQ